VVDAKSTSDRFVGTPVVDSLDAVPGGFDAVVVTDLQTTRESLQAVAAVIDAERVLVPALLGNRINPAREIVA
jgi:hypothetical protein